VRSVESTREGEEVEDGQAQRRRREDYEELDQLLDEVDRFLEDENLHGADEALKKAGVKAAPMWGEVGRPALPGHTRRLVDLIWAVQHDLSRPRGVSPEGLSKDLRELRSQFELEARREAGKPVP
jgi:hypothetical protein